MKKPLTQLKRQAGYSLIEVLVSVVVLAVGFLGMAGLQTKSLQNNQHALLRTQATYLSYEILERMRANLGANTANSYITQSAQAINSPPDCTGATANCTPAELVQFDIAAWRCAINASQCNATLLKGLVSEHSSLPNGEGKIEDGGNGRVKITISWQETRSGADSSQQSFQLATTI